jgi:hypothetical protein
MPDNPVAENATVVARIIVSLRTIIASSLPIVRTFGHAILPDKGSTAPYRRAQKADRAAQKKKIPAAK